METFWIKKTKTLSILKVQSWPRERKSLPFLAFFARFDINFLKNAWEFNRVVTWRIEFNWNVSNSTQNVTVLLVVFFLSNFRIYCSNVERNPVLNFIAAPII